MFLTLWFAVFFGHSPYGHVYPPCMGCGPPPGIPYHPPVPRPVMGVPH